MSNISRVIALIPARSGSKGIVDKNIQDVGGIPLMAYSIRMALRSSLIERVIVSTDSEEYADIAREYGAEVPFLRPKALATDDSIINETAFHVVHQLRKQGYYTNAVATFYPTHPFRSLAVVDDLVAKLLEGRSPVFTVRRLTHNRLSACTRSDKGMLTPLSDAFQAGAGKMNYYRNYGLFVGSNNTSSWDPYIKVIDDPISLIDIDEMADLHLARRVVQNGLYDLEKA